MSAREDVLGRVRAALAGDGHDARIPIPRDYEHPGNTPAAGTAALLDELIERLGGYDASVRHVRPGQAAEAVGRALRRCDSHRVIVPEQLDASYLPDSGFEWLHDVPPLPVSALADADCVLTAAAVAVADSGTIVLDGSAGQGRRVLSLVPDAMVVVLRADQVVGDLPSAIARLEPTRPMTFVSGPSATVDIELVRVRGVHGPRKLEVVVLDPDADR